MPACFPLPYSVEQYVAQEGAPHDVRRFDPLLDYPRRFLILHNYLVRNTTGSSHCKAWKRPEGRGASAFRTGSSYLDIPFASCREEVGYQRWIVVSLTSRVGDRNVSIAPNMPCTCVDEDCS